MAVKETYKKELLRIIHQQLPDCKVWLFGSRARGNETHGSDIDLALDCEKQIPLDTILDLRLAIQNTTIPMTIDLVDLHTVSEEFKQEVLKEGILWTS